MGNSTNLKPFTSENQPPGANKSRKGIPNRATLLRKWLDVKIKTKNRAGRLVTATVEDEVVLSLIDQAKKGNVKAQALILDSVYGKVADKLEADITGETTTTLVIKGK